MNIVDRVKKILMSPKTEWEVISAEASNNQQLVVGYVLPLAAVAAVASFIGAVFIGGLFGMRMGFVAGLTVLVMQLVLRCSGGSRRCSAASMPSTSCTWACRG